MRREPGLVARAPSLEDLGPAPDILRPVDPREELRRAVAVEVRGAERVLRNVPARTEDEKVAEGGVQITGLGGQDGVDAGIGVVDGDGVVVDELAEVVFVGDVVSVPGDDVEGTVRLGDRVVCAALLGDDGPVAGGAGVDVGGWEEEISRVGETETTERTELREFPFGSPGFDDVSSSSFGRVLLDWFDLEPESLLDDTDFGGLEIDVAKLGGDVQVAFLSNDQEVSINVDKCLVRHPSIDCKDVIGKTFSDVWLAASSKGVQSHCEIHSTICFVRNLECRPRDLRGNIVHLHR